MLASSGGPITSNKCNHLQKCCNEIITIMIIVITYNLQDANRVTFALDCRLHVLQNKTLTLDDSADEFSPACSLDSNNGSFDRALAVDTSFYRSRTRIWFILWLDNLQCFIFLNHFYRVRVRYVVCYVG